MSTFTNVYPQGTPSTEYLGAGAIYVGGDKDPNNWGTTAPTLFGTVTKGGSSFTDNAVYRNRAADADIFINVKGAVDLSTLNPQLTINTLAIQTSTLEKLYAGLQKDVSGATFDELIRTIDMTSAFSSDSFWWVGKNRAGDDLVIRLDNVVGLAPISFSTAKDEEIVISPVLTACADPSTFDPTDKDTYPYAIYLEKAA